MSKGNRIFFSIRLAEHFLSISYHCAKISETPRHPYLGVIFVKIKWFPPRVRGKASTKRKLIGTMVLKYCSHRHKDDWRKKDCWDSGKTRPPINSLMWHTDWYTTDYVQISYNSKSEWHWLKAFRVTQGQMWWCHWTSHIIFLSMFNGNVWHTCSTAPFRYVRLRNLSDLDLDFDRSRSTVMFQFEFYVRHFCPFICYRGSKCFLLSLIIRPNVWSPPPLPTPKRGLPPGDFFSNVVWLRPCVRGKTCT